MTATVSYAFDAEFAESVQQLAATQGKKPVQIMCEAFEDYRDALILARDRELYRAGKLETLSADEVERLIDAQH
ncbi:hypothetical protein FACS1894103_5080 [Campylobacterota bacterium]|nr:hypothetical protein FACS1894103_5080 [Campylobacterota bacterium]